MIRQLRSTFSEGFLKFLKNLATFSILFGIAKIFSIIIQVSAGRILGSYEYGKFSYVLSLSSIFLTFISFGIHTTIVKYVSENERKDDVFLTIIYKTIPITLFLSIIILFFSEEISKILKIGEKYIFASMFFAILLYTQATFRSLFMGYYKYKTIGILEILFLVSALIFFIILLKYSGSTVYSILFAYIFAYLLYITLAFKYFFSIIKKPKILPEISKNILNFSFFAYITNISAVWFGNIERVLLQRYFNLSTVGVFQAYYYSTITLVQLINTIFVTVYLPEISKRDRKSVATKINEVSKRIPVIFPAFSLISLAVVYAYGYGIDIKLLLIFLAASFLLFYFALYNPFLVSLKDIGIRYNFILNITSSLAEIISNIILVPIYGIYGAAISILISNVVKVFMSYYFSMKIVKYF